MPDVDLENEQLTDVKDDVTEPPMYKVILLNDDYTSMDFVVSVLEYVFHKSREEAVGIMLNVHEKGAGIAGVYSYEVAETKVSITHSLAQEAGFPLKATMEEE